MPFDKHHHASLPFFEFDFTSRMKLLYAIRVVKDIANKLGMLFLPIFIFELVSAGKLVVPFTAGLTHLQQTLIAIAVFFLIMRTVVLSSVLWSGRLAQKFGPPVAMSLGHVFAGGVFGSLALATVFPFMVWVAAVCEALHITFFWTSMYAMFAKNAVQKRVGRDLSFIQFMLQMVSVVVPVLAGVIALFIGYQVLFLSTLIMVVLGIILSLNIKDDFITEPLTWDDFWVMAKNDEFRPVVVGWAGRYVNDAVLTLWPLYVFILLGSIDRVGFLYTFSLFLSLMVTFFAGVYVDQQAEHSHKFSFSGFLLSSTWLVKTVMISFWSVTFLDVVDRVVSNFHWLVFDGIFLKRIKRGHTLAFCVYREMVLSIIGIVFWSALIGLVLILPGTWQSVFVLAAIGVLVSISINKTL